MLEVTPTSATLRTTSGGMSKCQQQHGQANRDSQLASVGKTASRTTKAHVEESFPYVSPSTSASESDSPAGAGGPQPPLLPPSTDCDNEGGANDNASLSSMSTISTMASLREQHQRQPSLVVTSGHPTVEVEHGNVVEDMEGDPTTIEPLNIHASGNGDASVNPSCPTGSVVVLDASSHPNHPNAFQDGMGGDKKKNANSFLSLLTLLQASR